jgi:erythromycin esterase-like protein
LVKHLMVYPKDQKKVCHIEMFRVTWILFTSSRDYKTSAIGVIYRPHTERQSHYFNASISTQFDCVIHIEVTHALRPLEIHPAWTEAEKQHIPDTFPMNV